MLPGGLDMNLKKCIKRQQVKIGDYCEGTAEAMATEMFISSSGATLGIEVVEPVISKSKLPLCKRLRGRFLLAKSPISN